MGEMSARIIRLALGVLGGALAAFHGWLFVAQAAEGRLEDPWLIFRWVASASLIAVLVALRRNGESVWGKKGIAIWVLAALLHGPSVAVTNDVTAIALPESVATSVLQLVSAAAFAVGLWILARRLRTRTRRVSFYSPVDAFSAAGHRGGGAALRFSPRPPPLRS